jgi:hypothetical protein
MSDLIDKNSKKKSAADELVDKNQRKKSEKHIDRDSDLRGFNLLTNDDYKSSPVKSRDYNLLEKKQDKPRDMNKEYLIFT